MGDVINLRRERKRRDRADREALAGANRAKFGRTKAEKLRDREEAGRSARALDGHQLDRASAPPAGEPSRDGDGG